MEYNFRQANIDDLPAIWSILEAAIARRKADGSDQWQDGYPNPVVIEKDIYQNQGFVLSCDGIIAGYCAVMINDEPAYASINGEWLSEGDFAVFHRVAISEQYLGKGLSKMMLSFIEDFARKNGLSSIKADTNFDNAAMQHVFTTAGYLHCGEVLMRGNARMAYEKLI